MGERLASCYDEAAADSLARVKPEDRESALTSYLADAHALESRRSPSSGAPPRSRAIRCSSGCTSTISKSYASTPPDPARLAAHDAGPSMVKDAAMRLGGLNYPAFFQAHPDTPGKLAAFAYAFEHLEFAGYELLARVARHVGDEETQGTCGEILTEESVRRLV